MADASLANDFVCPVCGQTHVLALAYSVKYPHATMEIAPEDVERRIVMTKDECVIDKERFYLRGRIPIPVRNPAGAGFLDEPFIWGVWVEVSPRNFVRANELWNTEGREREPLFRGYLDNELPIYGTTLNLEVDVQTQPVGRRPHFFVVDPEHEIAREQREGLSMERLEEITVKMVHEEAGS